MKDELSANSTLDSPARGLAAVFTPTGYVRHAGTVRLEGSDLAYTYPAYTKRPQRSEINAAGPVGTAGVPR